VEWLGFILRRGNECVVDDQWEKFVVKFIDRLSVLSECRLVGNVYCPMMDENFNTVISQECFEWIADFDGNRMEMSNGKMIYPRLSFAVPLTLMDGKMLKGLMEVIKGILLLSYDKNDPRLFPEVFVSL
jgi:hypothetical protein